MSNRHPVDGMAQPGRHVRFACYIVLLLSTLLLFSKTHTFEFINYDDGLLLTGNPHVNSGFSWSNLVWAFSSVEKLHWAPLTWISHMLDFQLFGNDPSGHHLVNVAFHLLNTLLLQLFLFKTTNRFWQSSFVAALFALHPLHVEPVAWVSARKDVLSTLFFMTTLLCYARYAEQPGIGRYLPVLGTYALGLMSKPMLVTVPFLLLLLDYWPLRRIEFASSDRSGRAPPRTELPSLFYEKIPLLVLSGASSALAYISQSESNAISTLQDVPSTMRFATAVTAYATYLWKMVWPAKLALIYPLRSQIPAGEVLAASVFLLVATASTIWKARTYRYLPAGWFWFLGTLIPVIGIVQIGSASMADKFTYVPLIGIFIMIAWGIPDILKKWRSSTQRTAVVLLATTVLVASFVRSWNYLDFWRDSIRINTKALEETEDNFLAWNNLGQAFYQQGRVEEAFRCFLESVRVNPRFEIGYYNVGHLLMFRSNCREAIPHFTRALEIRPDYQKARTELEFCRQMNPGTMSTPSN